MINEMIIIDNVIYCIPFSEREQAKDHHLKPLPFGNSHTRFFFFAYCLFVFLESILIEKFFAMNLILNQKNREKKIQKCY